jgi:hypothetical protein
VCCIGKARSVGEADFFLVFLQCTENVHPGVLSVPLPRFYS